MIRPSIIVAQVLFGLGLRLLHMALTDTGGQHAYKSLGDLYSLACFKRSHRIWALWSTHMADCLSPLYISLTMNSFKTPQVTWFTIQTRIGVIFPLSKVHDSV